MVSFAPSISRNLFFDSHTNSLPDVDIPSRSFRSIPLSSYSDPSPEEDQNRRGSALSNSLEPIPDLLRAWKE